jgi:hypothetical protein
MRKIISSALALGGLTISMVSQAAEPASADYKISEAFTHQNLAVFLIQGKDALPGKNFLTLQEALEQKKIVVHETGTVGQLAVENVSTDVEVFIQSGDIVKGGRQDRVLAYDLIVPAKSGQVAIASFCVEAGRWQKRGAEDDGRFSQSTGQLPGKALRLAVNSARQQGQVWQKVKEQQDKLSQRLKMSVANPQSPSSLQLTLENTELLAKVNAYVSRLEKRLDDQSKADKSNVIGMAITINGKLEGAEIYGSAALFRKMWPKLLRTAAVDAFAEHQPGRRYELADGEEISAFLSGGAKDKEKETKVNDRIRVITRESANHVSIETRDQDQKGARVHKSYIAR